jgi:hypothetical protein
MAVLMACANLVLWPDKGIGACCYSCCWQAAPALCGRVRYLYVRSCTESGAALVQSLVRSLTMFPQLTLQAPPA